MPDTYYVQVQAKRRLTEMIPIPPEFDVHPDLLMGLDRETFARGFHELHALFERFYEAMRVAPAELGLPLYEVAAYRSSAQEARASGASVYHLPNLLYCLGRAGEIVDGGLEVDRAEFTALAKGMRVKGLPLLVKALGEAGFAFSHWNGKAFDRKVSRLLAGYPATPSVLQVLKVAATRATEGFEGPKHRTSAHFYAMDHKLLASAAGAPQFDVADFCHLIGPETTPFFEAYHGFMMDRGYGYALDDDFYRFQYLDPKGKPTLDYFRCADYRYGKREGLTLLRLKLNHVAQYNDYLETCPERVKQGFREAWKCHHCTETCGRRVAYRIDGQVRESCICDAFAFFSPQLEDVPIYQTLFDLEQDARTAKSKKRGA